jgi:hypothetical protein
MTVYPERGRGAQQLQCAESGVCATCDHGSGVAEEIRAAIRCAKRSPTVELLLVSIQRHELLNLGNSRRTRQHAHRLRQIVTMGRS